ncbi:MAG TPA: TlyA family RNA methyltransferase [Acidobacteriaceae bacterium]|nr:TlyA family RNA methyltransferase [Acidobacteriaceae bacterium]
MRLDKLIVERNLAPTRSLAQRHIVAGRVSVDGTVINRAAFEVESHQAILVTPEISAFASRGGQKLAAALDHWQINLQGRVCLDIGISTGGFADCMLRRGAAQVIGVDSGHSQLSAALRTEPRLHLLERTNARYLTPSLLPEAICFLAIDVSFIAASLVLPAVVASAFPQREEKATSSLREAVILVKPQFEAGRQFVGKGGIVRSASAHRAAVERVQATVNAQGAQRIDVIDSPILGGDGNREFLLYARF